ncbi:MAG: copper resistance protein CopC [Dehalococcoidia bacterium]|nr:copper resistance protein CopC [Dehalococcoidia bacterium]
MKIASGVLALLLLVAACLGVSVPRAAYAHASFLGSDPAADSVLPTSPSRVTMRFSEAMAPTGSDAQIVDSSGRRVDLDDAKVDPNDLTQMAVSVSRLADGTYTVAWHNVSAVDGHGLQGSFVFFVGSRPPDAPSSASTKPPLLQSRVDPAVRWFTLFGALVATGAILFDPLILRFAAGREPRRAVTGALETARGRIAIVARAGAFAFLGGTVGQLLLQAGITAGVPAYRVTPGDVADIFSTAWGLRWLVRFCCLVIVVVLMGIEWGVERQGRRPRPRYASLLWVPVSLLLVVAMAMVSLSSHGAATTDLEVPGAINDGLHLAASALWVGGLCALVLTVRAFSVLRWEERRGVVAALVARFSLFAGLSVGVLLVTGLYSSWLQVTSRAAFDTPYGSVLAVKLVLVAGLLTLGALNLLWVRPRLAQIRGETWLRRLVLGEVALAVLVVVTVAGLTSLEPARQVHSRDEQQAALSFGETVQGTRIGGTVAPGTVGTNRVVVTVADRNGAPVNDASNVLVRLKFLDRDLSPIELTATSVGGGRYEVPPTVLSIVGAWQIEVEVSRPGSFDARTASRFLVTSPTDVSTTASSAAPPASDGRTYWSWVMIAAGALVLVLLPRAWTTRPARARSRVLGTAVVLAGVVLFYGGHTHAPAPQSVLNQTNPYPPDSRSIEAGRLLYEQQCVKCHGAAGHGDGPEASGLVPPPADLSTHVPLHTDGTVFYFISSGFPGTAMPAFAGTLSEQQRWDLVNYLRTLAQPLPSR